MKIRHGVAFPDADQFMADQVSPEGTYQLPHLVEALKYVTDWSLACDVGAHVGTWSVILATQFGRVVAFEPAPDTFEALQDNLKGAVNVELHNVAVGAGPGSVSLALDAKNEARANTGARYVQAGGPIPMITIDALDLPSLGFLKLDVEGSEFPALLGARQTIARCRPVILFEDKGFGSRFGVKRGQIEQLLTGWGYHKRAQLSADQVWIVS